MTNDKYYYNKDKNIMKSFVEYLLESNQPYEFRFKIAGELSDDCISRIESRLDKHGLESMSKPKRTPIQEQPAGFAQDIKNTEVNIIDVSTNYPTTPHQLLAMLTDTCGLPESHIVVINKNDPEEVAREAASKEKESEYEPIMGSEYPEEKQDEVFGDKYNENMLKELETRKFEIAKEK